MGAKRGTEIKKHRGDNAVQYNDSYWRWVGGWGRGGGYKHIGAKEN